ncbi:hypothetical protein HRH59_14660 [Rheinheimera sp. YQF-2]|uniref:Uncharacterized protein n=1 Tax=Rheinheimera lutimaris TaxID=2740584 RepID=A0A7Y5ASN0_9GAMM|nr:hypothetical protein [Rheinheimera lutimaris]NRQ43793.1 hypothetical protein [Rheinheimera lutimaris]
MSYLTLCSITLNHQYFSDGLLQQGELVVAGESKAALQNAQLLFKPTKQGGLLLLDSDRRDITAACCDPVLTLYLLLYSKDPQFGSYSAPSVTADQLLYCDNRQPQASGALHAGPQLASAELMDISAAELAALSQLKRRPLPVLVLALAINRAAVEQLTADNAAAYSVQFGCRHSIWRYYLCGSSFNAASLHIADMAQQQQFVQRADTRLPNGRLARVFESGQPLMLTQFSPYRFALVSRADSMEKILIKRLPVAAAGQFDRAVVNGVESNVSEIYLNY